MNVAQAVSSRARLFIDPQRAEAYLTSIAQNGVDYLGNIVRVSMHLTGFSRIALRYPFNSDQLKVLSVMDEVYFQGLESGHISRQISERPIKELDPVYILDHKFRKLRSLAYGVKVKIVALEELTSKPSIKQVSHKTIPTR